MATLFIPPSDKQLLNMCACPNDILEGISIPLSRLSPEDSEVRMFLRRLSKTLNYQASLPIGVDRLHERLGQQ